MTTIFFSKDWKGKDYKPQDPRWGRTDNTDFGNPVFMNGVTGDITIEHYVLNGQGFNYASVHLEFGDSKLDIGKSITVAKLPMTFNLAFGNYIDCISEVGASLRVQTQGDQFNVANDSSAAVHGTCYGGVIFI